MIVNSKKSFSESLSDYEIAVSFNGYVKTDEKWHQGDARSLWSRVYYVLDGSGYFTVGDRLLPIEPGYVYFAPCGLSYGFYGTPSVEKLFFHVNLIMPSGYDLFGGEGLYISRAEKSVDEMRALVKRYFSDSPADIMFVKSELWSTVTHFADEYGCSGARAAEYSSTVKDAVTYIRQNLSAPLTAASVAEATFCSVCNLNDKFKKEIGTTVGKYINDLLMFEAGRLLAADGRTIGEISAALGFCDQFYFSRRFAGHFLMTPREYRKIKANS